MKLKKAQASGSIVISILIIIMLLIIFIAGAPAMISVVREFVNSSDNSFINLVAQFYLPFTVAMIFLLLFSLIRKS